MKSEQDAPILQASEPILDNKPEDSSPEAPVESPGALEEEEAVGPGPVPEGAPAEVVRTFLFRILKLLFGRQNFNRPLVRQCLGH